MLMLGTTAMMMQSWKNNSDLSLGPLEDPILFLSTTQCLPISMTGRLKDIATLLQPELRELIGLESILLMRAHLEEDFGGHN